MLRQPDRGLFLAPAVLVLLAAALPADEIHTAVQQSNLENVKKILDKNPKAINAKDTNGGFTPLHYAVMYGRSDMIEPLLAAGADITVGDNQKQTPLQYALQPFRFGNNSGVAGTLLKHLKNVNAKLPSGEMPLHFAARHGLGEAAKSLLDRKADPEAKDSDGHTPLQLALAGDHAELAELLIPKTDVRAFKTIEGDSLLHWSASRGLVNSVKSLMQRKAQVNAKNAEGDTPLHLAAWNGHYQVVGTLLDAGANPNVADGSGRTALHSAAWNGHLTSVTTLGKGGAAVNVQPGKSSPLHAAAWQGHTEVARALLDFGARVNDQDDDGSTPLHKAAWRGNEPVVRLLLARRADPTIKESSGLTALELARSAKKEAVVAVLLKAPKPDDSRSELPAELRGTWLLRLTSADGGKTYRSGGGGPICEVSATEIKFVRAVEFADEKMTVKKIVPSKEAEGATGFAVYFASGKVWKTWQRDNSITVMIYGQEGEKLREAYRIVVRVRK